MPENEMKAGACEPPHGDIHEDLVAKRKMASRLTGIKHRIVVLSGKGGVGKSTVAVNIAVSLSLAGKRVGLLDVDIHGPSIPTMLKLTEATVKTRGENLMPVMMGNLKVMSVGFLLQQRDSAVIWRGPMKMGAIEQLIRDVEWGDLDYMIVDSPPGTGDEPLSVIQLMGRMDGAVMVTTPQEVAASDVRKSLDFCRKLDLPVLGIVENMSGFICPHCGKETRIWCGNSGEEMALEAGVPFLGRIPLDPSVSTSCDGGTPFVHAYGKTETARRFEKLVEPLLALEEE